MKLCFASIKLSVISIQFWVTQSAKRPFDCYQEQKEEEGEIKKVTKTSTVVKMSVQFWNDTKWKAENRTGIDKGE